LLNNLSTNNFYGIFRLTNKEDTDERTMIGNQISLEEIIKNNFSSEICFLCIPIGYYFYNNTDLLIENCIKLIRTSHNNSPSIACGIATAYMISMALNKVDINQWLTKIIELLKTIDLPRDEFIEYNDVIRILYEYNEKRFDDGKLIITKSDTNLMHRIKSSAQIFKSHIGEKLNSLPGSDIISSLLMAYDALLLCNRSFEKLVYYSILTLNGSTVSSCIAGELYDILYGTENIPQYLIDGAGRTRSIIPTKFFENINL